MSAYEYIADSEDSYMSTDDLDNKDDIVLSNSKYCIDAYSKDNVESEPLKCVEIFEDSTPYISQKEASFEVLKFEDEFEDCMNILELKQALVIESSSIENSAKEHQGSTTLEDSVLRTKDNKIIENEVLKIDSKKIMDVKEKLKERSAEVKRATEEAEDADELFHNCKEKPPVALNQSSVPPHLVAFHETDATHRPFNHASRQHCHIEAGKVVTFNVTDFNIRLAKVRKIIYQELDMVKFIEKDYCLLFPTVVKNGFEKLEDLKVKMDNIRVIDELGVTEASVEDISDIVTPNYILSTQPNSYVDEDLCWKECHGADILNETLEMGVTPTNQPLVNTKILLCRALPKVYSKQSEYIKHTPTFNYENTKVNIAPTSIHKTPANMKRILIFNQAKKLPRSVSLDNLTKDKFKFHKTNYLLQQNLKKSLSETSLSKKTLKRLKTKFGNNFLQVFEQPVSLLSLMGKASVGSSEEHSSLFSRSSQKNSSSGSHDDCQYNNISDTQLLKSYESNLKSFVELTKNDEVADKVKILDHFDTKMVFKMNSLQLNNFCFYFNQQTLTHEYLLLTSNNTNDASSLQKRLGVKCGMSTEDAPLILNALEKQEVLDGSRVELKCKVKTKSPFTAAEWYVDGVKITASNDISMAVEMVGESEGEYVFRYFAVCSVFTFCTLVELCIRIRISLTLYKCLNKSYVSNKALLNVYNGRIYY